MKYKYMKKDQKKIKFNNLNKIINLYKTITFLITFSYYYTIPKVTIIILIGNILIGKVIKKTFIKII